MIHSTNAPKKCRQIDLFEAYFSVNGTAGTPAASGLDALAILSVEDLGTGNYKLNFKDKAQRALIVKAIVPATASRVWAVTASDASSVTLQFKNLSGVNSDADFNISVLWHGSKHLF